MSAANGTTRRPSGAAILSTVGIEPPARKPIAGRTQDNKDEEWEEPVPLGTRAELPAFPVQTLPGWMSSMVSAVATEIQVPEDLPGSLAMGMLSTAAGGRAELVVRGQWREPLNVYLVTAMPPAAGKSPAFKLMAAPVFAAEGELRETARRQIMGATIARDEAVAEAENKRATAENEADRTAAAQAMILAKAMAIPVMPRLTADDINPEQAATIMAEQGGRLAILSAEGTFFSVIMGRYTDGRPNVELVLKAHAGDRVQVDRRGRDELIEHPALTMATTVQPAVLREMAAKPAMRERGLLARFLINIPVDLVGTRNMTPDLVPEDIRITYAANMKKLIISMADWTDPAALVLTPGALKLHTEWRTELEPRMMRGVGDLDSLRDWAGKLPGATARMAGLLHLARLPDSGPRTPVDESTMADAIVQARYWAEHAMAAFGVMRAHPSLEDARAVLDWIGRSKEKDWLERRSKPPGADFTRRDAQRAMQRRFDAKTLARALGVLETHGYIRPLGHERRSGPKSNGYLVHPSLLPGAVTR